MPALTAILIAYNEELDLPRALASLEGVADEIILVDSGSTDRTCEIARARGARVYARQLDSLAEQKNYAASFCVERLASFDRLRRGIESGVALVPSRLETENSRQGRIQNFR